MEADLLLNSVIVILVVLAKDNLDGVLENVLHRHLSLLRFLKRSNI